MKAWQVPQAGWSQMTAAQRQVIAGVGVATRANSGSKRRSKTRAAPSRKGASSARGKRSVKRAAASKRSSAAKFVKGSAAARRHMARLRAMRKK